MRFHVKLAALLTLVLLPLSAAATEYKDGTAPPNSQPPFSQPVQGWDNSGKAQHIFQTDASGNQFVNLFGTAGAPTIVVERTNRTLAAGATDSTTVPMAFTTLGYHSLVAVIRLRQGTYATQASCELAIRLHNTAVIDSTQGWVVPIGTRTNTRGGRTVYFANPITDRLQTIAIRDTVTGYVPAAPYLSSWFKNNTGVGIVYDLTWILLP